MKQNIDLLLDICGPGQPLLARTAAGQLMICQHGDWQSFDFNGYYQGQYPDCKISALAYTRFGFLLAGLDKSGQPHLFSSLLGTVWEMKVMTETHPLLGSNRVAGEIIRILEDRENEQVILVCRNGQWVTLSDCPRCIRIRQATNGTVSDATIADGCLIIKLADSREISLALNDAVNVRADLSFAQEQIRAGQGYLIDLRPASEFAGWHIPGSINIELSYLSDWIKSQPKTIAAFFICRNGVFADDAAQIARRMDLRRAYSLGSIKFMTN